MLYNKTIVLQTSGASDRSDVPFRLTLGHMEVIQIRRVEFSVRNTGQYTGGSHVYGLALSSADLEPVSDAVFNISFDAFCNRHDIIVCEYLSRSVITRVGFVDEPTLSRIFDPGEMVLPRSPSGILYAATLPADDPLEAVIQIYYQKMRVSQADILNLMKIHKSIKPATVPRVIDT